MSSEISNESSNGRILGMPPVIGRGVFVFAAGMALAAVSFVVEQAVIKVAQNNG